MVNFPIHSFVRSLVTTHTYIPIATHVQKTFYSYLELVGRLDGRDLEVYIIKVRRRGDLDVDRLDRQDFLAGLRRRSTLDLLLLLLLLHTDINHVLGFALIQLAVEIALLNLPLANWRRRLFRATLLLRLLRLLGIGISHRCNGRGRDILLYVVGSARGSGWLLRVVVVLLADDDTRLRRRLVRPAALGARQLGLRRGIRQRGRGGVGLGYLVLLGGARVAGWTETSATTCAASRGFRRCGYLLLLLLLLLRLLLRLLLLRSVPKGGIVTS